MADNIDILLKLFATLKESSDKNEEATKQLIIQQLDLVGHIKHLPIDDLRQALKDHAKDSAENIDSCEETVTTTSGDLMTEIKKINNKLTKIIIAVSVAFTVVVSTYGLIKAFSDKPPVETAVTRAQEHKEIADGLIKAIKVEVDRIHNKEAKKGS